MKRVFAISFDEEEPPFLCTAANEGDAIDDAKMQAERMQIQVRIRPAVSLEGEFPDFEDFCERYSTVSNPHDTMVGMGGRLFGWAGDEWDFVKNAPPRVWTLIENENLWWRSPGIHYVNRLGYLVTREARDTDESDYLYD